MKRISKKTGIVVVLLLMAGTALFGWGGYHQKSPVQVLSPVPQDTLRSIIVDSAKLSLLSTVYSKLNQDQDEFLIIGTIDARNGADTADHLSHADYIFSKKGMSFYLKIGSTETINANGLYLFVDNDIKKVMVSKEKQIIPNIGMPKLSEVIKRVKEEGYSVISEINGNSERITLSNPYHLSCKEYAIEFNSATLIPQRLYLRLSDFSAPENAKKDNVIDFRIKKASPVSDIEKYTTQTVVTKAYERWTLGSKYRDYELINKL